MIDIAPPLPRTRSRSRFRSRTMQAMLWQPEGCAMAATLPVPCPAPGQLLIRASGYGLSLHEIAVWRERCPNHPGAPSAEGWGVVESVGREVVGFEPGDPVAFITSRGYAEYTVTEPQQTVVLPPALADGPFLLRSMAGVVNLFRRSRMESGDIVAIVGSGFLGLLSAQLTALAEARTVVITRRELTRQLALSLGADATLATHDCAPERLRDLTGGTLCDYAIEAAGCASALQLAAELTRPRGQLIIAGTHPGIHHVDLPLWSRRGLDIINAHEPSPTLFRECMREAVGAVAAGLLTPHLLYTHRFPLAHLSAAIRCATLRPEGFLKALIHIQPCPTLPPPPPHRALRGS